MTASDPFAFQALFPLVSDPALTMTAPCPHGVLICWAIFFFGNCTSLFQTFPISSQEAAL